MSEGVPSSSSNKERQSQIRGHATLKERRYHCEEENCRVKPFSNKHDLARHRREVHRKDSEGRTPREYHCPVVHCKRHHTGFGRQWNMQQHCLKVHSAAPSQIQTSTVYSTAQPGEASRAESSLTSPTVPDTDLHNKLEAELKEARLEQTRTLKTIDEKIEGLRSERETVAQKSDEKIKALENLIGVLGGEGR